MDLCKDITTRIFVLQVEPLQSSFSVAALLGEELLRKDVVEDSRAKKHNRYGDSRPGLPPTPQPSDEEEDEPDRKRYCTETCELAKVIKKN